MSIYTGATSGVGIIPGTDLNSTNAGSDNAGVAPNDPNTLTFSDTEVVRPPSDEEDGTQEYFPQRSNTSEFGLIFSFLFLLLRLTY